MFIGVTLTLQALVGCASLDVGSRQSAPASGSGPTTAVVLRTFGDISKQQSLVNYYLAQLGSSHFQLSVLHDAGSGSPTGSQQQIVLDSSAGIHASKTRIVKKGGFVFTVSLSSMASTSTKSPQSSIPVCVVSWAKAEQDYGKSTMDAIAQLGTHSAHDQFLSLWYRHCDPLHTDYTWFLEDDVRFSGQVTTFFTRYGDEDADLVSSGLRVANSDWWKWSSISEWMHNHTPTFSQSTKAVKNLEYLPSVTAVKEQPTHGVLFFQDHIMRASDKLLQALDKCFDLGIAGPSESFLAQVCGSKLYFEGDSPCTILDFAPADSRNRTDQWVSGFWSWDTVFESSGKDEVCSPQNRNKWYHKCESNPEDFNCEFVYPSQN